MKTWANTNAIYQIYPRSFYDTSDDGIGDLRGIIEKLDYLKGKLDSLGIDAIWISPFYPSPMKDFGYDVSDYCDIHPMFGTLDDFKQLLAECHERGIKVIIDFVPNHTSDQHPWFREALENPQSSKRDYYVWRDPVNGGVPNNWVSIFGGSMWELHAPSYQYYAHTFLKEQPDLNWDNPAVREEMKKILHFWLELGVDGFRADAVPHIGKDSEWRDEPINPHYKGSSGDYYSRIRKYSKFDKKMYRYLRELTEVVESYPDKLMVFEAIPDGNLGPIIDQFIAMYDINPRVGLPFNFGGLYLPWGAKPMGDFVRNFQNDLRAGDRAAYCFSNHDEPRIVSRFGRRQARIIAMLLLSLPGLPTIYYGDEIGMENAEIPPEERRDPAAAGNPLGGRDPERSPMQWTNEAYAGFSTTKPWLPVAKSYKVYNVAKEKKDRNSMLALYRALLKMRAEHDTFINGDFIELSNDARRNVLVFERRHHFRRFQVALNFSPWLRRVEFDEGAKVICHTTPSRRPRIRRGAVLLRPYEGIIVQINNESSKIKKL